MKYPKLRELKEAFTALIKGPYTTKFPKVPSPAAPAYRGKPEFNEEECVVCGACANVCPAKAIEIVETKNEFPENSEQTKKEDNLQLLPTGIRRMVLHYDVCIFCGQCEVNCLTEKGIHLTQKYDLATLDRKECIVTAEDELLFCEYCGESITTKKHLQWLVERLGPQAFSNPNLFLASYEEIKLLETRISRKKEAPLERSDHLRLLCPRCRKQLTLKEEWGHDVVNL